MDDLKLSVRVNTALYHLLWGSIKDHECPRSYPIEATIHGVTGRWTIVAWDKRNKPWCEFCFRLVVEE